MKCRTVISPVKEEEAWEVGEDRQTETGGSPLLAHGGSMPSSLLESGPEVSLQWPPSPGTAEEQSNLYPSCGDPCLPDSR